jgi:adenylate kinase
MKSKKLAKADIESITNIQGQFTECTNTLGLLQIDEKTINNQLLMLEEKKNETFQKLDELRNQEQELFNSLQEKYGQGQINLQEGTFTPNN